MMPSKRKIRTHWANTLISLGKFDSRSEVFDDACFACGLYSKGLERAHIRARCIGGSDDVENIHLLCGRCHRDSEGMDGSGYLQWFIQRTMLDALYSQAARDGVNIHSMLASIDRGGCNDRQGR
jgi:hypothetical protein